MGKVTGLTQHHLCASKDDAIIILCTRQSGLFHYRLRLNKRIILLLAVI